MPFSSESGGVLTEDVVSHWLGSVFCVFFSALTLLVGWVTEGHPACKNKLSLLEQLEEAVL